MDQGETIVDTNRALNGGKGFINHVFNFNNDTKVELMNLAQYLIMVLIPLSFLNKFIETVIPKPDESRGSIEILVEVLGHSFLLLASVFMVDRIAQYAPSYSGKEMNAISLATLVIVFVMFTTKTRQKMDLLYARVNRSWNGEEAPEKKKQANGKGGPVQQKPQVTVSQPITGMPNPVSTAPTSTPNYMAHHTAMTPQQPEISMGLNANPGASNGMYNNQGFGGLQGAASPGIQEPMAANDGFGGAFGSAF
tara:strand:- start:2008 stop:2760 length:753 start_codon:yes stop_codon:yes gene_type:complete